MGDTHFLDADQKYKIATNILAKQGFPATSDDELSVLRAQARARTDAGIKGRLEFADWAESIKERAGKAPPLDTRLRYEAIRDYKHTDMALEALEAIEESSAEGHKIIGSLNKTADAVFNNDFPRSELPDGTEIPFYRGKTYWEPFKGKRWSEFEPKKDTTPVTGLPEQIIGGISEVVGHPERLIQEIPNLADSIATPIIQTAEEGVHFFAKTLMPVYNTYMGANYYLATLLGDFIKGDISHEQLFMFESERADKVARAAFMEMDINKAARLSENQKYFAGSIRSSKYGQALEKDFGEGAANLLAGAGGYIADFAVLCATDPIVIFGALAKAASGRGIVSKIAKGPEVVKGLKDSIGGIVIRKTPVGLYGRTAFGNMVKEFRHKNIALNLLNVIPQDVRYHGKISTATANKLFSRGVISGSDAKLLQMSKEGTLKTFAKVLQRYKADPSRQTEMVRVLLDQVAEGAATIPDMATRAKIFGVAKPLATHRVQRTAQAAPLAKYAEYMNIEKRLRRTTPQAFPREVVESLGEELLKGARDPIVLPRIAALDQAAETLRQADRMVRLADEPLASRYHRSVLHEMHTLIGAGKKVEAEKLRPLLEELASGNTRAMPKNLINRFYTTPPITKERALKGLELAKKNYGKAKEAAHASAYDAIAQGKLYDAAPELWGIDADFYLPGKAPEWIDALADKHGIRSPIVRRYLHIAKEQMYGNIALKLNDAATLRKPVLRMMGDVDIANHPLIRIYGGEKLRTDAKMREAMHDLIERGGNFPLFVEPSKPRSSINYFVRYWQPDDMGKMVYKSEGFATHRQARSLSNLLARDGIQAEIKYGPGTYRSKFWDIASGSIATRRLLNVHGKHLLDLGVIDAQSYLKRFGTYYARGYLDMVSPEETYKALKSVGSEEADELAMKIVSGRGGEGVGSSTEARLMKRYDHLEAEFAYTHKVGGKDKTEKLYWSQYIKDPNTPVESLQKRLEANYEKFKRQIPKGGTAVSLENTPVTFPLSADQLVLRNAIDSSLGGPAVSTSRTLAELNRLVHEGRFCEHVGNITGLSKPFTKAGVAEAVERWGGLKNVVRLPEKKIFGPLSGKVVPKWLWTEIHDMHRVPNLLEKLWMNPFKFSKTIASERIYQRNTFSNIFFSDALEVPVWRPENWKYYLGTLRHGAMKTATHKQFVAMGAREGLWSVDEFRKFSGRALRTWDVYKPNFIKVFKKLSGLAKSAYGSIDLLFKEASYLKQIERGASPEQAMAFVRTYSTFYDLVPQMLKTTTAPAGRRTAMDNLKWFTASSSPVGPYFVAFPAETARIIGNMFKNKPLKLLKWLGITSLVTSESILRSGRDPSHFQATVGALGMRDENAENPLRQFMPLVGMIHDAGKGKYGRRDVYTQLGDLLPFALGIRQPGKASLLGKFFPDSTAGSVAQSFAETFIASNPIRDYAVIWNGKHPHTGKDLWTENDDWLTRWGVMANTFAQSVLPDWVPSAEGIGFQGGSLYRDVRDVVSGDLPDFVGKHKTWLEKISKLAGMRVEEIDDRDRIGYVIGQFVRDDVKIVPTREYMNAKKGLREDLRGTDATTISEEELQSMQGYREAKDYMDSKYLRKWGFDSMADLEKHLANDPVFLRSFMKEYPGKVRRFNEDVSLTATQSAAMKTFSNMGLYKQKAVLLAAEMMGLEDAAVLPYLMMHGNQLMDLGGTAEDYEAIERLGRNHLENSGFGKGSYETAWVNVLRKIDSVVRSLAGQRSSQQVQPGTPQR